MEARSAGDDALESRDIVVRPFQHAVVHDDTGRADLAPRGGVECAADRRFVAASRVVRVECVVPGRHDAGERPGRVWSEVLGCRERLDDDLVDGSAAVLDRCRNLDREPVHDAVVRIHLVASQAHGRQCRVEVPSKPISPRDARDDHCQHRPYDEGCRVHSWSLARRPEHHTHGRG
jgi:hypothetical protein